MELPIWASIGSVLDLRSCSKFAGTIDWTVADGDSELASLRKDTGKPTFCWFGADRQANIPSRICNSLCVCLLIVVCHHLA
jgi:hypothetical protein